VIKATAVTQAPATEPTRNPYRAACLYVLGSCTPIAEHSHVDSNITPMTVRHVTFLLVATTRRLKITNMGKKDIAARAVPSLLLWALSKNTSSERVIYIKQKLI
jgi:hypothetical protein